MPRPQKSCSLKRMATDQRLVSLTTIRTIPKLCSIIPTIMATAQWLINITTSPHPNSHILSPITITTNGLPLISLTTTDVVVLRRTNHTEGLHHKVDHMLRVHRVQIKSVQGLHPKAGAYPLKIIEPIAEARPDKTSQAEAHLHDGLSTPGTLPSRISITKADRSNTQAVQLKIILALT